MADYYALLDVSRDATEEEIRRSYRKLALRFHPDRAGPEGAAQFKEIQSAYEVLSNPGKRNIYDQFGAAAVDNPMFSALLLSPFIAGVTACLGIIFLILGVLLVLFVVFLVEYVDGHFPARSPSTVDDNSRTYWNYVGVFVPLFVVDGFVLMLTLPWLVIAIYKREVRTSLLMICVLSLIVLSVLVPVAKDANDMTTLRGGKDFHLWRIWLLPLYTAAVFFFLFSVVETLLLQRTYKRYAEYGGKDLKSFVIVFIVLRVLRGLCLLAFCVLLACRADEVILTNYYVVIVIPFFAFAALLLVELVSYHVYLARARDTSLGCCFACVQMTLPLTLLFLSSVCVVMVSKRLNDVSRAQRGGARGNEDILPLARALAPIYILLIVPFVLSIVFFVTACLGKRVTFVPTRDERPRPAAEEEKRRDSPVLGGGRGPVEETPPPAAARERLSDID